MLLFQDIAVIPMLAIIPLLAVPVISASGSEGEHGSLSLVESLLGWAHGLAVVGAIVIVCGHYLSRSGGYHWQGVDSDWPGVRIRHLRQ